MFLLRGLGDNLGQFTKAFRRLLCVCLLFCVGLFFLSNVNADDFDDELWGISEDADDENDERLFDTGSSSASQPLQNAQILEMEDSTLLQDSVSNSNVSVKENRKIIKENADDNPLDAHVVVDDDFFNDESNKVDNRPLTEIVADKIKRFVSDDVKPQKKKKVSSRVHTLAEIEYFARSGKDISSRDIENWVNQNDVLDKCLEYGYTMLLYLAAKSNNAYAIQYLIEQGADLQPNCTPRRNGLHLAAQYNPHANIVDLLFENQANWVEKDTYGNTALGLAAAFNPNPKVIKIFLLNGIKIGEKNNLGQEALMLAVYRNSKEMVATLLSVGADVNAVDYDGRTALMAAGLRGDKEIIELLLSQGADANKKDKLGLGVMDYFAKRFYVDNWNEKSPKDVDISHELKDKFDFIVKNYGMYQKLLEDSVKNDMPKNADLALKNLADPEIKDEYGCTMLLEAVQNGSALLIETLLSHDVNVMAQCKGGKNALHFLLDKTYGSQEEILDLANKIKLLLEAKVDVNAFDDDGKSPFYYAFFNGAYPQILDILFSYGANQNAMDKDGKVALHIALENNASDDFIYYLVEHGGDIYLKSEKGDVPFWLIFTDLNRIELSLKLIERMSDVNLRYRNGDTPLLFALKNNYAPVIIRALIAKGADVSIRDANGDNAFDIIKRNPYFQATVNAERKEEALEHWN